MQLNKNEVAALVNIVLMLLINVSYSYKVRLESIIGGSQVEKVNADKFRALSEKSHPEYNHRFITLLEGLRNRKTDEHRDNYARYCLLPMAPTNEKLYLEQIKDAVYAGFVQLIEEHVPYRAAIPADIAVENFYEKKGTVENILPEPPKDFFDILSKLEDSDEDNNDAKIFGKTIDVNARNAKHLLYEIKRINAGTSRRYWALRSYAYSQKMFLLFAFETFKNIDEKFGEDLRNKLRKEMTDRKDKVFQQIVVDLDKINDEPLKKYYTEYKNALGTINEKWLEQIIHTNPINGESISSYMLRCINLDKIALNKVQLRLIFNKHTMFNYFNMKQNTYAGVILKVLFASPYNKLVKILNLK